MFNWSVADKSDKPEQKNALTQLLYMNAKRFVPSYISFTIFLFFDFDELKGDSVKFFYRSKRARKRSKLTSVRNTFLKRMQCNAGSYACNKQKYDAAPLGFQ